MTGRKGKPIGALQPVNGFLSVASEVERVTDVGIAKGATQKEHIIFIILGKENREEMVHFLRPLAFYSSIGRGKRGYGVVTPVRG